MTIEGVAAKELKRIIDDLSNDVITYAYGRAEGIVLALRLLGVYATAARITESNLKDSYVVVVHPKNFSRLIEILRDSAATI